MLTILALALADPPVMLYDEPLAEALSRLENDLGPTEVRPRRPTELLPPGPPRLVGAETLRPCAGPPTRNAELLRLLAEAEELRVALRPAEVSERLAAGLSAWACLGEPADPTLGARLHFLVGIQRQAAGDGSGADEAFRAALRSDPALAWDPDFAPDARPRFDAARAERPPASVTLTVVPPEAAITLRVDGRVVVARDGRFELAAGRHFVQLEDGSGVWGDLVADAWLLVPARLDDGIVHEADAEAGRRVLEGVVRAAALPPPVYVPTAHGTWTWAEGWSRARVGPAEKLDLPLVLAGGAAALGGGAWMGVERAAATGRQGRVDGGLDSGGYEALEAEHAAGLGRWRAATGLTLAGGAVLSLGATLVVVTW